MSGGEGNLRSVFHSDGKVSFRVGIFLILVNLNDIQSYTGKGSKVPRQGKVGTVCAFWISFFGL